jgi:hypothetical protein
MDTSSDASAEVIFVAMTALQPSPCYFPSPVSVMNAVQRFASVA